MNTTFFENEKIKIYAGKLVDQFDGIYFFVFGFMCMFVMK